MNVLHLTSDWKFTGPAEPMLIGGEALRARGHRVDLVCPPPPDGEMGVFDVARERGVDLEHSVAIERGRGIAALRDLRDVRAIRSWMAERELDVVHVWHTRAHSLALRARGASTALVRAHSDGLAVPTGLRGAGSRWLYGAGCDALVCTSRNCMAQHADTVGAAKRHAVSGAVDLERFRPAWDVDEREAARGRLGLRPKEPAVGVVARVQSHRRFDVVFEVLSELRHNHPLVQLVILGRGTHIERVARRPVAELGLETNVVFAGHRTADYAEILRSLDALVFLVPGSDGGCRAVLEAAASGLPVVASRRGALPELIGDGTTGYCVDEKVQALVPAVDLLLQSEERRAEFRRDARMHAERWFSPERLGEELERVYESAVEVRRR